MRWFGRNPDVHHKSPGQPVTPADLAADALLRESLLTARPTYGWLSEETADHPDRLQRRRVWVVDPIDGTRSFIAGYPEFAVSVGLVDEGRAVLGVVLNPALDEVYWAVRGVGAWGAAVSGGAASPLVVSRGDADRPVLVASRSEIRRGEIEPVLAGLPGTWQAEGLGSTAFKMARIAAGRGDGFASRGPKSEWDVCAGALLVEMAGGKATDIEGAPFRYNRRRTGVRGVVAASARFHETLLGAIMAVPG
jgi:myo-inositol-1(or 4)-monophosphatase